jgi:hypothetical protein
MTAISRVVADKLFEICNWTHEAWVLYRTLFDDNPDLPKLSRGRHAYLLHALNHVLQEYVLLQVAKLHDPAVVSGRVNLSLAYFVEYGGWDPHTSGRLRDLKARLDELDAQIRPARNRILSHNDFATLVNEQPLGAFPKDADLEYFRTLHEFVSCIFEQVTGVVCADFATFTRTDVQEMIRALLPTATRRRG